ncbi:MAG: alpha/beta hydrolase-fold protein [Gammaproteobacteria bacterium]|nr:alpha/beta hydrolase-fold protein [Gammaproteobacteria bacterium]
MVGIPLLLAMIAVVTISWFDQTSGTIVTSGERREFLLHVPDSYDPTTTTPLIISLHAGATWPAHQMNLSRWNQLADEHGFIVVYPAGIPEIFNAARIWQPTPEGVLNDSEFISTLIDMLIAQYNIDETRIYANGMSMGGGMAFALSCTLSDRIAAIGMVAAAQALPFSWCPTKRPAPLIAFHGTADVMVPYQGGPLGDIFNPVKPVYPPVREFTANWAQRNRCASDPAETPVAADVIRLEYRGCAEEAHVVLYTILGGGHSWPGGKPPPQWRVGTTSNSIDATREMWTFFQNHALTQRGSSSITQPLGDPE